jgi:hypothetical protein
VCDGSTISANVLGIFFPAISYISHLHYSSLRAGIGGSTEIEISRKRSSSSTGDSASNNTRRMSAAPYLQIDEFSRVFHPCGIKNISTLIHNHYGQLLPHNSPYAWWHSRPGRE